MRQTNMLRMMIFLLILVDSLVEAWSSESCVKLDKSTGKICCRQRNGCHCNVITTPSCSEETESVSPLEGQLMSLVKRTVHNKNNRMLTQNDQNGRFIELDPSSEERGSAPLLQSQLMVKRKVQNKNSRMLTLNDRNGRFISPGLDPSGGWGQGQSYESDKGWGSNGFPTYDSKSKESNDNGDYYYYDY